MELDDVIAIVKPLRQQKTNGQKDKRIKNKAFFRCKLTSHFTFLEIRREENGKDEKVEMKTIGLKRLGTSMKTFYEAFGLAI